MAIVRKKDGSDVEVAFSELVGEKREDGRFHVKLKDGGEGIVMHPQELENEREERRREQADWWNELLTPREDEKIDPRPGLQQLFEDYNKS